MQKEIIPSQDDLVNLKESEFKRGERPNGSIIGAYRSESYSIFKARQNPLAGGAVDLILSGDFVNSAYLKRPSAGKYIFGFRDHKARSLFGKYGTDIAGLNQNTFNQFLKEKIKPNFVREIKNRLR